MPIRELPFLLGAVFILESSLAATIDVPQGTSIQRAIDSAAPNDIIAIAPGTYREQLVLKDGVTLIGTSRDDVFVEMPPSVGNVLVIKGCFSGGVRSIAFRHVEVAESEGTVDPRAVVSVANSNVDFDNCTVSNGFANGIRIEGAGHSKIRNCVIRNNRGSGIALFGKGMPEIVDNSIENNDISGIVFHESRSATVSGNVLKGNKLYGFWPDDTSSFDAANNDFTENALINAFECRAMFRAKQFGKLEALAERVRREKTRYAAGGWLLPYYYIFLSEGVHGMGPDEVKKREALLKEWEKAFPDSITWRILLVNLYTAQAWKSRGNGFANTVSQEAWKGYSDGMQKARTVMDGAATVVPKDAEYYVLLSQLDMESPVSRGDGLPGRLFETAKQVLGGQTEDAATISFHDGVKLEPLYTSLYTGRVRQLLPRWHGSYSEMMAFANSAASNVGGDDGDALYAIIASEVLRWEEKDTFLSRYSFSWGKIQTGYEAFLKQFPESNYYRNAYARMACVQRDGSVAARVFGATTSYDEGYWTSVSEFEASKAWALGTGAYPERSALEIAVDNRDADGVRKLIAAGGDAKARTPKGETLLELAIYKRDYEMAQALVDAGADIDAHSSQGEPLIKSALGESKTDALDFFITNKANLNVVDKDGWTPMANAIVWGRPHLAKILLESGADPNAKSKRTPLQVAIHRSANELIPELIAHGADVNYSSDSGNSPLELAAAKHDIAMCRVLLEHGANPNSAKHDGWTALFEAADSGNLELAQLLVEHGADVNKCEADGWTPFHMAVMAGHKDVLEFLLAKKPDGLQVLTNTKSTLLHAAAKNGRTNLVTFLIESGLDINAREDGGITPLGLAIDGKHEATVRVLRDAGATK